MQWSDITVQQFQQLSELWQGAAERDEELVMIDMACICYNMTEHQVDSLSVLDLRKLVTGLAFLNEIPAWQPVKFVTANGRRYRFVYDVRQIHAARNMEVKQFGSNGLIPNMHRMAASMVVPQARNRFGRWKDLPYDAAKHEQYASDLLQAPITAVHGSALFFCEVFSKSIQATADYLTSTIPKERRTEAQQLLLDSCRLMAGSTTPSKSQSSSVSASPQLTSFPTSNS